MVAMTLGSKRWGIWLRRPEDEDGCWGLINWAKSSAVTTEACSCGFGVVFDCRFGFLLIGSAWGVEVELSGAVGGDIRTVGEV
ncbi:hypothetical protein RchiOBHm_Chr1g0342431 [Rosa chinensis]|uniref:Uncharacterized protein n=1 Tax=Rosa chinensis TaxID=74649 RepID=A0A2P6SE08_ROSCH|nr:hypothetical protein RchiOBHm_Chr1g0342431 [Rosa chinensis]